MSSSKDKTVRVWDATEYKEIARFEYPGEVSFFSFLSFPFFWYSHLILSFNNLCLCFLIFFLFRSLKVFDFCVSSDGKKLVAVGTDRLVHVRDMRTGDKIAAFVGHMMHVCSIFFFFFMKIVFGVLQKVRKRRGV